MRKYRRDPAIIGIVGHKRSGKGTVAQMIQRYVEPDDCFRLSFADPIKRMVVVLAGSPLSDNHKETPIPSLGVTPRELLQYLGTDVFRESIYDALPGFLPEKPKGSVWIEALKREIIYLLKTISIGEPAWFVIEDMRFEDEDRLMREFAGELGFQYHTIRVMNPNEPKGDTHRSETEVDSIRCTSTLVNDGTKKDLEREVGGIMEDIMRGESEEASNFFIAVEKENGCSVGTIELLDWMGSDTAISQSARVSTGSTAGFTREDDARLIHKLMDLGHSTPFESCTFRFRVIAPIFVARQWMRHRTQSYVEKSLRYQESNGKAYVPVVRGVGSQEVFQEYTDAVDASVSSYSWLIDNGEKREDARSILPLSTMTEFFVTLNLWNLFRFTDLRLSESAQEEIRGFAEGMIELLRRTGSFSHTLRAYLHTRAVNETIDNLKQLLTNRVADLSRDSELSYTDILTVTSNDADGRIWDSLMDVAEMLLSDIRENTPDESLSDTE